MDSKAYKAEEQAYIESALDLIFAREEMPSFRYQGDHPDLGHVYVNGGIMFTMTDILNAGVRTPRQININ